MRRNLALVVTAGLLLTGCASTAAPSPVESAAPSSSTSPSALDSAPAPEPSSTQTLDAPQIDATDRGLFDAKPDEVVTGAILDLLTFDTAVDTDPGVVAARASDWFVPGAAPTTVPEPWGSQWEALTAAGAVSVVQDLADVTEAGAPADTAGAVARQYLATVRVSDANGTQTIELVLMATLARTEGGYWLLDYLEAM